MDIMDLMAAGIPDIGPDLTDAPRNRLETAFIRAAGYHVDYRFGAGIGCHLGPRTL